jgi:hypothetical protein
VCRAQEDESPTSPSINLGGWRCRWLRLGFCGQALATTTATLAHPGDGRFGRRNPNGTSATDNQPPVDAVKKGAATLRGGPLRGGSGLTDASAKLHLTLIGSAEECKAVQDDLANSAALAVWKDKVLVQAYRPTAWAVTGVGFNVQGSPRIVLQGPPDAEGKARVLRQPAGLQGRHPGPRRRLAEGGPELPAGQGPRPAVQARAVAAAVGPFAAAVAPYDAGPAGVGVGGRGWRWRCSATPASATAARRC